MLPPSRAWWSDLRDEWGERSASAVRAVGARAALDILAVAFDEVADPLAALAGMRAGVLDRATKAHIVANDLRAQVIDVGLLHLELSRRVAAIVGLVSIRQVRTP